MNRNIADLCFLKIKRVYSGVLSRRTGKPRNQFDVVYNIEMRSRKWQKKKKSQQKKRRKRK